MAVINFLIIAFVVFMLVKMVNRVKDAAIAKEAPVPAAPKGPTQEQLLADIRDLLKARS
jgi:large conductance mechanosensitive channel